MLPRMQGDSSDPRPRTEPDDVDRDDDESTETPLDHPLFLPAILFGLAVWFFWDGFVDPMVDHLAFNQGGFVVFALATAWYGYKGVQELRERRERDAARGGPDDDRPIG
jgi:hypothetical protein